VLRVIFTMRPRRARPRHCVKACRGFAGRGWVGPVARSGSVSIRLPVEKARGKVGTLGFGLVLLL
jgi:hypothetical protein